MRRSPSLSPVIKCGMLAATLACSFAQTAAGSAVVLAPHRAVYDMTLETARGAAGVSELTGRMVYELTGSACEGYTQNTRFVTRMTNQSGETSITDMRSSMWEDGEAKRFRFNSSNLKNDKTTETTIGDAERTGDKGDVQVDLTQPAKKSVTLAGKVYFPVQHSIAVIEAARAGSALLRADLYDGSEKGEKTYDTTAAIGRKKAAGVNKELPAARNGARLDEVEAWPVSISYFEKGSDKQDALPVYEMSFLFFDNGVSRKLLIDYGDFAVRGELTDITFLEPSKCEPGKK